MKIQFKSIIKCFFSLIILSFSLSFSNLDNANAAYMYYTNNTRNYWGITNKKFWAQDDSLGKTTNDAMYLWNISNYTGVYTNMNIQRTWNKAASIIDVTRSNSRPPYYKEGNGWRSGVIAETINDGRTGSGAFAYNWGCSNIRVYNMIYNYAGYNLAFSSISHEIGHSLGLMHNCDWGQRGSIMYYPASGVILGPTYYDMLGVKHLYG